MATAKKRTLEEFLSFSQPQRNNYVLDVDQEGKVTSTSDTSKMKYDPKTKKSEVESAAIDVSAVAPVEEAQAPRKPIRELLPPVEAAPAGDPPPAAPKYEAPAPAAKAPEVQGPQGPSVWERVLIGATPALVGLISGNELEGMQLSGQTLASTEADLYKREKDFYSRIAEMKAKRDLAGSNAKNPNYARQELYDPKTGKTYVHSIVDGRDMGALGEASPAKSKESFQKTVMRNPETGKMEVAIINPKSKEVTFYGEAETKGGDQGKYLDLDFQGEPTKAYVRDGKVVNYVGKLPEKKSPYADLEAGRQKRFEDQKILDLTKEFTKPTSSYNKMKENLDGIVMAAEQLNLGNPRANAGLQNYLARNIYGEKGPLSDSDIARLAGDPSYAAVIERFMNARIDGKLGELDRSDIRQILDLAYKVQVEKMMSEASRFGSAFATVGYDPTPGIQAYVKGSIRPIAPHRTLGKSNRSLPTGPKAGEVMDGYKFKGGDPSKKENWEKQ
jgi:hypothetical protein